MAAMMPTPKTLEMDTIPKAGVGKNGPRRKSPQLARITQSSRWPWAGDRDKPCLPAGCGDQNHPTRLSNCQPEGISITKVCRGERIRTSDLLNPINPACSAKTAENPYVSTFYDFHRLQELQ